MIFPFLQAILGIDDPVTYYDTGSRRWVDLPKFPRLPEKDNIDGDSCVNVEGHLYVSRGTKHLPRKLKCPQFLRLDMENSRWIPLESMIKRRKSTNLVALNGRIYAIGGDVSEYESVTAEVYNINNNAWYNLPALSQRIYRPTPQSCVAYEGKVLVYGRGSWNGESYTISSVEHHLLMYDPRGMRWSNLLMDSHLELPTTTGLVVNEGKCYRVTGGCTCKNEGCKGHDITVHEVIIDFNTKVARIGEKHDQDLITRASLPANQKNKAFRINKDVYLIYHKQFFKTGIKLARNRTDPVKLGVWQNLKRTTTGSSLLLSHIMFDKAKWL